MNKQTKMFADFLLIVFGVLIALMVESWIEESDDDSLRQTYLVRLIADMEHDKQTLINHAAFFSSVRSYGMQTLSWLRSEKPVDKSILLASYYSAEIWPFQPVSNTYSDLLSTGNIRLLNDIDLRMELTAYYAIALQRKRAWNPPETFRGIIRGTIPPEIQMKIRKSCPNTEERGANSENFNKCSLPETIADELNIEYESLRARPEVREVLSYHVTEIDVAVRLFREQAKFAEKILTLLKNK